MLVNEDIQIFFIHHISYSKVTISPICALLQKYKIRSNFALVNET